jgi:S-adenosylmethionine hydrolase
VYGNIPILDPQYGNVWTNIDRESFRQLGVEPGESINLKITHGDDTVLQATIPYARSFGAVDTGEPLLYLNSLNNVALALNQGNFATTFDIQSGAEWSIFLSAAD